jgi:Ca2+-binding RTX toxin-like protein
MPIGNASNNAWEIRQYGEVNTYDGRDGVDSLSFDRLPRSYFTITQNADGSVNVDSVSGASALYRLKLISVELLYFSFGSEVVDLRTAFNTSDQPSVINGTGGNDTLSGTSRADSIAGLAGNDSISGAGGNDTLQGGDGTDTLVGGQGDDQIEGGSGIDFAAFSATSTDVVVSRDPATGFISVSGVDEGRDVLVGVERAMFRDRTLAFDIDGNSGQAYRLYRAAFDRKPDLGGLGFYIWGLDSGVVDLQGAAATFFNSVEFKAIYGESVSNEHFVELLYRHVHHRSPDAGGLDFWIGALVNQGGIYGRTFSRAEVLVAFSESAENKAAVIGIISNGIEYLPFTG